MRGTKPRTANIMTADCVVTLHVSEVQRLIDAAVTAERDKWTAAIAAEQVGWALCPSDSPRPYVEESLRNVLTAVGVFR